MNKDVLVNGIRFIGLLLFQVLILKRIDLGGPGFNYFQLFIYPLAIMLLPIRTPRALVVALGFLMGIGVDLFYDSIGIHASALVFMGFTRSYILQYLRPREGYSVTSIPSRYHRGLSWFVTYAGILLLLHLFFYYSVVLFTYFYIGEILIRTFSSFIISLLLIVIHQMLFKTVN